jgi:hypothetical protein
MIALIPFYFFIGMLSLIWAQPILFISRPSKAINPLLAMLVGLSFMSILAMLMLFVGPINLISQVLFWLSSAGIAWLSRSNLKHQLHLLIKVFSAWSKPQLSSFILLAISILYQSAQASKIHDNGAYYQQTIQWMEQFGLVKGLANLYPALGLYSNWHALTALLDLNQIGLGSYHQINGYLMLLFLAWALNEYFIQKQFIYLTWIAICLCLGFFYLTAPSADLAVLLLSGILVYYFIKGIEPEQIVFFAVLALAIFLIKPPAMVSIALCVYLVYLNRKKYRNTILLALFSIAMIGSFFYKNTVLSGYLFYPNNQPDWFRVEWKVPKNWSEVYTKGIVSWGVSDKQQVSTWNTISKQEKTNRLVLWLNRPGYKGFMNQLLFANWLLAIIGLVVFARSIWKHHKALLFLLLFLITAHYWEWLKLSQYRLMLPTGMGLLLLWLSVYSTFGKPLLQNKWVHQFVMMATIAMIWALSFFPFQLFQEGSRNKQITASTGFNSNYLLEPFHQYEYGPMSFIRINGKAFYHYQQTKLSWNCALPCVSKSHHDFLLENLGYEVQMLGDNPATGFKLVQQTKP